MLLLWTASVHGWMMPEWIRGVDWRLPWIAVAAFIAGMLNAVAGGGSLLSFPAMLGIGLGPIQANATNTVALWPGQLMSIAGYWSEVRRYGRLAVLMALAGLLGGGVGAGLLLRTPATTFMKLVPWLLLAAALIFAVSGPVTRRLQQRSASQMHHGIPTQRYLPLAFMTLLVCFYIGYFGAGAGFLIIALLSLFGFNDLTQMNAMKVVSTTMANGVACLVFAFSGKVEWHFCVAAMVTCGFGGYLASRTAQRLNPRLLRFAVVLIGLTVSAFFFWKSY